MGSETSNVDEHEDSAELGEIHFAAKSDGNREEEEEEEEANFAEMKKKERYFGSLAIDQECALEANPFATMKKERYFGMLAKEPEAPLGANPFATTNSRNGGVDERAEALKMIEEAKRQTERQRVEREKVEKVEREKERVAMENKGFEYRPRERPTGEANLGSGDGAAHARRKVLKAKRPLKTGGGGADEDAPKTNAFASLLSKQQQQQREEPEKSSVFSRLSKKNDDDVSKTAAATTTTNVPLNSIPNLFPGLAKFDEEEKKAPPRPVSDGGAGVFAGFTGFTPKSTSTQTTKSAVAPSSMTISTKNKRASAFAKELGIATDQAKTAATVVSTLKKPTAFAKELGFK